MRVSSSFLDMQVIMMKNVNVSKRVFLNENDVYMNVEVIVTMRNVP